MVHDAFEAVDGKARAAIALICCIALLGACGGSSEPKQQAARFPAPGVGSVRSADCTDWKHGEVDQRHSTVVARRKFAGGPVGSSAGIQRGPVLEDDRAYKVLQSYCKNYFARGFKLYKLYDRAATMIGHAPAGV